MIEADKSQSNPTLNLKNAIVPRFCLDRRRYGVNPASHNYHLYRTALIAATRNGHIDIVKALVDHLPTSVEVMDDYGLTALMWVIA